MNKRPHQLIHDDLSLKPLLSFETIQSKIQEVSKKVERDYQNIQALTCLVVMKGALYFAADFTRHLTIPVDLEFITAKSYSGKTQGEMSIFFDESTQLEGKDILLIDDIYDTGKTLSALLEYIKNYHPRSLRTLVLLNKQTKKRDVYLDVDYSCFEIEDHFIVGYGMDYHQYYRNLPEIYEA